MQTSPNEKRLLASRTRLGLLLVAALCALGAECAWTSFSQPQQRPSTFAARRAADDSRPLTRVATGETRLAARSDAGIDSPVVLGKFRAPAPERIYKQRIPKSSQFGSQTMSASYQVADSNVADKIVHGVLGAGPASRSGQQARPDQRTVGARMQVSDEGLNYPPSKLSADIYGNVAEIVTAPPEAVESDFLLPNSRRFSPSARP